MIGEHRFFAIPLQKQNREVMIKLLTRKEAAFLSELAVILKKYDTVIAATELLSIRITVYESDVEPLEETDIYFLDSFDENEIEELLEYSRKQAEQVKLDYADGDDNRPDAE